MTACTICGVDDTKATIFERSRGEVCRCCLDYFNEFGYWPDTEQAELGGVV